MEKNNYMGNTYSIRDYSMMLSDAARVKAYTLSLSKLIASDSIVLDLGAGFGVMGTVACKLGAKRVYAIESNKAIKLANEFAKRNGVSDKIVFIQGDSREIIPNFKADIIVSDLRGKLPLFESHIETIVDARKRYLLPGGQLIPAVDNLFVCLIEDESLYIDNTEPWSAAKEDLNLDLSLINEVLVNSWSGKHQRISTQSVISNSKQWIRLDYREVEATDYLSEVELEIERTGVLHGILIWLNAELTDRVVYSAAPGEYTPVYGSGFFPLTQPLNVNKGDQVKLVISANLIEGSYQWSWTTNLFRDGEKIS